MIVRGSVPTHSSSIITRPLAVIRANVLITRRVVLYPRQRRAHRRLIVPSALSTPVYDVADYGSLLSTLFVGSVSLAIAVNIGISSLPLLTGAAKTSTGPTVDTDEEDGIKWGVMTIISCFPLLNWLAWVFAAFDDEERAPIYYTNAFVYLLPWLSRGFELDRFSIACLLVGIAHVQVERIAQTEPEIVQLPSPDIVRKPLEKAAALLGDTTRAYEEVIEGNLENTRKQALEAELEADKEMRQRQLEDWDAKLRQRQKDAEK
ncbi:hypothetical protein COCOBI_11-2910 [Coccomyxa sp. Obi]|nr:hypothetical protein COCOBI_11-2910 [Coccomyxa sp. Obi]